MTTRRFNYEPAALEYYSNFLTLDKDIQEFIQAKQEKENWEFRLGDKSIFIKDLKEESNEEVYYETQEDIRKAFSFYFSELNRDHTDI